MSRISVNRRGLDKLMRDLPVVMEGVKSDFLQGAATGMRQRVHVLSGQTLGSVEVNEAEGVVSVEYGGYWEWLRGGEHNFIDPSVDEALSHAADNISDRLTRSMGG